MSGLTLISDIARRTFDVGYPSSKSTVVGFSDNRGLFVLLVVILFVFFIIVIIVWVVRWQLHDR